MADDRNILVVTFQVEDLLPETENVVVSVHVSERLSDVYRATVVLETTSGLEPEDCLLKKAAILVTPEGDRTPRCFHGLIVDIGKLDIGQDRSRWEVIVEPAPGLLRVGRDHRIFLDKSVKDIVTEVLEGGGVPPDEISWSTQTGYEPLAHVTQYGESDFDFVRRLLELEGIGFAVVNDLDVAKIELFDDLSHRTAVQDGAEIPFEVALGRSITSIQRCATAASDAAMVRDYDLTRPSVDLSSKKEAPDSAGREVYLHPARFTDEGVGARRAERLLERLQLRTRTVEGTSTASDFEPGRTFELVAHPRADANGEYFLLEVEHRFERSGAGSLGYENRFLAIPSDKAYRPHHPPVASPAFGGVQVGLVTGSSGAELHGSERGQVKARFIWDRSGILDDKSSTWMRVGQLPMPGSMVIPRVGFEVLIDHELGDLDRPVVVGHLYNGEARPPYELPGGNTISTIQTATTGGGGGANELRLEDGAGKEEIFINGSKDYTCSVENDSRTSVSGSETSAIGSNATVGVGSNLRANVTGSRTLSVGGSQSRNATGNFSDACASLTVDVGGTRQLTVGGDLNENIKGDLSRTVGGLQCVTGINGVSRKVIGSNTVKVGGAWLEAAAGSRASSCSGVRTETIGALKYIKAAAVSLSCGAAYVVNCASQKIKAGGNVSEQAGAALALSAGGGLAVTATNINIVGEDGVTLQIGGTSISVKGGTVTIKSGKIDLKGVKALSSSSSNDTN